MGKKAIGALGLAFLAVLVAGAYLASQRLESQAPALRLEGLDLQLGTGRPLTVSFADPHSGLRKARVELVKDGKQIVLFDRQYSCGGWETLWAGDQHEDNVSLTIDVAGLGLSDGDALLRVAVRDFAWRRWFHGNSGLLEMPFRIDTRPPQIQVFSQAHNISQGGAGLVVYQVSEPCSRSGVRVGEAFFTGFGGRFQDLLTMVCFFALSHEQGPGTKLALEAVDMAGNTSRTGFVHYIRPRAFAKDTIELSEAFMEAAAATLANNQGTATTALERFLAVNRDLRQENDQVVQQVSKASEPTLYWEGTFLRLPAAAPRAGFADRRTYVFQGTAIDNQVHLGVDLASLAQSPVPAANRGKVAHVGAIGIYGQTVIIDHGFGLMSLYAHLSSIAVGKGQIVEKGQPIGRTGATGLAGGDHLHFAMLVHDTFVTPVEWWDAHWIADNVTAKLVEPGRMAADG